MNTDNMAVSGETLDFGPCAFMDAFDPGAVFSSIDRQGRYVYGNQPHAAAWNLSRFAETLLPLIEPKERAVDLAQQAIAGFSSRFEHLWLEGLRRKLGLETAQPDDAALIGDLLKAMHRNQADFTLTFRGLCDAAGNAGADAAMRALFADPQDYDQWAVRWRQRLAQEGVHPEVRTQTMKRVNPLYIPRNHRIEQVITAAQAGGLRALRGIIVGPLAAIPGRRRRGGICPCAARRGGAYCRRSAGPEGSSRVTVAAAPVPCHAMPCHAMLLRSAEPGSD